MKIRYPTRVYVRFKVMKAVFMKIKVFWHMTSWLLVNSYEPLREVNWFHVQGQTTQAGVPYTLYRQLVSPKRR